MKSISRNGPPNVNFSIMHPCNNFGLWTVNKKLDECVTLHSNFLEMSYELNIKMKCLAPLHLGDVKNFLIPPRMTYVLTNSTYVSRSWRPLYLSGVMWRRPLCCLSAPFSRVSRRTLGPDWCISLISTEKTMHALMKWDENMKLFITWWAIDNIQIFCSAIPNI